MSESYRKAVTLLTIMRTEEIARETGNICIVELRWGLDLMLGLPMAEILRANHATIFRQLNFNSRTRRDAVQKN